MCSVLNMNVLSVGRFSPHCSPISLCGIRGDVVGVCECSLHSHLSKSSMGDDGWGEGGWFHNQLRSRFIFLVVCFDFFCLSLFETQHLNLASVLCTLPYLSTCYFPLFAFQTDSTASIYVMRKGFSRMTQDMYFLPIEINDNGVPPLSSTQTLTIRVCSCDSKETILSCNVEPFILPAGLSTGALIAILACIVILLGKALRASSAILLLFKSSSSSSLQP